MFIIPRKDSRIVGAIVPAGLRNHPTLSNCAKWLWTVLSEKAGLNGQCYPSYGALAKDIGVGRRYVRRAMKELVDEKLIYIKKRLDNTNTYHFLEHPCLFERGGQINTKGGSFQQEGGVEKDGFRALLAPLINKEPITKPMKEASPTSSGEQPFTLAYLATTEGDFEMPNFQPNPRATALAYKTKLKSRDTKPDFEIYFHTLCTEYGYPCDTFTSKKVKSMVKSLKVALAANKLDPYKWIEEVVKEWKTLRKRTAWKDSGKERLQENPSLEEIAISRTALIEALSTLEQSKNSPPSGLQHTYIRI